MECTRRGGYQPPATPDNISAQVNGMQSSVNVGDDAHIVPPQVGLHPCMVEWCAVKHDRRGGYQPPATPDNISAQVNGMQFSGNVGDDAHIVPPSVVSPALC